MLALKPLLIGGGIAAVLIAGMAAGWQITRLRLDAAQIERDLWKAQAGSVSKVLEKERASSARVSVMETEYQQRLSNAQKTINDLRSAVESGNARLRIKANCPTMPDTTNTPRFDNDSAARLTDTAERNYWILRERHEQVINQVLALQAFALECSKK